MRDFRIKICGITSVEDALMVVNAGADAIGLNFYSNSPRYVTPTVARAIARAVGDRAAKVGVFVNADAASICDLADHVGLDLIQLHGDEPPEAIGQLGGRPVMKAFRIGADGLTPVAAYLTRSHELGSMPCRVLFDAKVEGMYGGSGQLTPWNAVAEYRGSDAWLRHFFATTGRHWQDLAEYRPSDLLPPMVLAGGLSHENVAVAIGKLKPAAVDTASGVETSPGRKDLHKVTVFVNTARSAFD